MDQKSPLLSAPSTSARNTTDRSNHGQHGPGVASDLTQGLNAPRSRSFAKSLVLKWLSSLAVGELVLVEDGIRHRCGGGGETDGGRRVVSAGSHLTIDQLRTLALPVVSSENSPLEIHVLDPRFYSRVLWQGSLGAAESYLRGEWTCDDLVPLFRMLARNSGSLAKLEKVADWLCYPAHLWRRWGTRNTFRGSRQNIHAHYDLGNDFFRLFLDETMTYSSGIFAQPDMTLREASIEKYDRICRKLRLQPHHHLVEIGTGWGGFAIHAASRYGCQITTTTISQEQYRYATRAVEAAGLSDRVQVVCQDYRNLTGQFDRLVSIEMIEAVGAEFLPVYFQKCESLLVPGGEMVIQAITIPDQRFERYRRSQDFIQTYVFPGGCLPSLGAISRAVETTDSLQMIHLEDFAIDYAITLAHWRQRFLAQLPAVRQLGLDDRFIRLWDYYLAYCEAGFREQLTGVAQLQFRK